MKNNQVKITFQDDKQKAVVQITQNGNEVSVSIKFTPELDMAGPDRYSCFELDCRISGSR